MQFIENIGPKIDIELYSLEFNTKQIANEILSQPLTKFSEEDTNFNPLPNSESLRFIKHISNFAFDKNFYLHSIWSHIHQPLESTNTHDHGRDGFSFVYYIQVPKNSGVFRIHLQQVYQYSIIPKEGTLILFPSWLPHLVTKNLSNNIRVSISGNLLKKT